MYVRTCAGTAKPYLSVLMDSDQVTGGYVLCCQLTSNQSTYYVQTFPLPFSIFLWSA